MSALKDIARLRAKPRRIPQNKISKLANLDTSYNMSKALRDGRVNGILAHIALHTCVVSSCALILRQPAPLDLVLMCRVPRP
jgi:hypothetical protein